MRGLWPGQSGAAGQGPGPGIFPKVRSKSLHVGPRPPAPGSVRGEGRLLLQEDAVCLWVYTFININYGPELQFGGALSDPRRTKARLRACCPGGPVQAESMMAPDPGTGPLRKEAYSEPCCWRLVAACEVASVPSTAYLMPRPPCPSPAPGPAADRELGGGSRETQSLELDAEKAAGTAQVPSWPRAGRGVGRLFCEGPDGESFRLCWPYSLQSSRSAPVPQTQPQTDAEKRTGQWSAPTVPPPRSWHSVSNSPGSRLRDRSKGHPHPLSPGGRPTSPQRRLSPG